MAFGKLLFLVFVFLPIIFARFAWADPALPSEDAVTLQPQDDLASRSEAAELELHQLKSKISFLEFSFEDQTEELRSKDSVIKQVEKLIEEKSNTLASLQAAVQSHQKKSLEETERVGEVNTRVNELGKQVENIRKEIEAQNTKKDALEARAHAAEKKIEELNHKLEYLQKINDEQKLRIRKTQHALQVAEEEMLKAKLKASSVTKQLKEVHQAWLPPWLSAHILHCQSFVLTHWNEIGRPAFDQMIQKALKQKYEIEKWAQPHLETMKTKWSPTIKKQYNGIVDNFYPLVQSLVVRATEYYHLAQSTIKLHIVNIEEAVDPYVQEAKMFIKPYVDQVSEITKPHLDKAQLFLKPYSKKLVHHHRKISKNVQTYHSLVQATLHEALNSYELTKPLATQGLVWFMASILMVLPVIVLLRLLPLREPKKRHRNTSRSHNRRARRAH